MLKSLILGFGKAGRELHLHCLRKAQQWYKSERLFSETVGVVDPRIAELGQSVDSEVALFRSLAEVRGFDPASTVVHICTPPGDHLAALRQAAEMGYSRILVEKPLATSPGELDEVMFLQRVYNLDLLVVANWLSSSLTVRLKTLIDSGQYGPLQHVRIDQTKSRFARTLANSSHGTAFDVEVPHQVALALYLAGQEVRFSKATCSDMAVGNILIPNMGSVEMRLLHNKGITSLLYSDLTTHIRKRSVELHFERHLVTGYYPTGADESYSRLVIYDWKGQLLQSELLEDDPLTASFHEYYRYYHGIGTKPVSEVHFNAAVVRLIHRAKALCGIVAPEVEEIDQAPLDYAMRYHNDYSLL